MKTNKNTDVKQITFTINIMCVQKLASEWLARECYILFIYIYLSFTSQLAIFKNYTIKNLITMNAFENKISFNTYIEISTFYCYTFLHTD